MNEKSPKNKLIDKINAVNNILITVSNDPTVDQLAATLGLTMALTKLGKRSVAVFSGQIPRAINFLHPEKTFESNADSLRDFIISLDKDKADRLRCKAEGDFVKVYITPYRTKITPADLKFEDGDFNIELIIAIGVIRRSNLDAAIASHGKIFHNATVATINWGQPHDGLGMISWQDDKAGCCSEMCANLVEAMSTDEKQLVDSAIATAFLTGIVASTDQFRNDKTSPALMTLSADLMARGANQQLITSELTSAENAPAERPTEPNSMSINNGPYTPTQSINLDSAIDNPAVTERIQEEKHNYGRERSADALSMAQARLSELNTNREPVAGGYPSPQTPPVEPMPPMAEPMRQLMPQSMTEPASQSIPQPLPQPIPQSMPQPGMLPTMEQMPPSPVVSPNMAMENNNFQAPGQEFAAAPMAQMPPVGPAGPAGPVASAYGQMPEQPLNQPLPSMPAANAFPMPDMTQPSGQTDAFAPVAATPEMPNGQPAWPNPAQPVAAPSADLTQPLPPLPPLPPMPDSMAGIGAVPASNNGVAPVSEPGSLPPLPNSAPVQPAQSNQPAQSTDPSQFVIPS